MAEVDKDQAAAALRLAVAKEDNNQPTIGSLSAVLQSDGAGSSSTSFSVISDADKEQFTVVSISDNAGHSMDRPKSSILTSTPGASGQAGTPRTPSPSSDQQPSLIESDADEELERDSAFGDDASEENGRRYHGYRDGKYLLPNDLAEQERLDLHHHIFNLAIDDKLFMAPVENPQRVYDGGTGTGIWAVDFAEQVSQSIPALRWLTASKASIPVDDIEDTWRHEPFSFIHLRSLSGAIKDWPALLAQAYDHIDPGGWIEVTEFEVWIECQNESVVGPPPMIQRWQEGLTDAGERIGRSFKVAKNLKRWLEMVGFVGVVESVVRVPNAPWPKDPTQKEIGVYQQQNMIDASSSYGQAHFTRVLGWTKEEYDVLSARVRNELKSSKYHLYSNLYVVYGQRPSLHGSEAGA
ncbi:S-adenosyl-L-methionine-dependent methyltransferase [Venustampulla echinocandica]|uniref:S-adenosyl-L-methionine-dependent methyltransferase n=1 Tax=Venustampulla echinocandica TaxID=2656787 RepID=A0A370TUR2_9HELO|nr:S-adenosyl-L-methionine-dependent methyltransferase [Venustampulla echinocandica]RDL39240.1 S-adenosyl-L-methionine-dependent methyltransferase [Venustampulla echinocandica]